MEIRSSPVASYSPQSISQKAKPAPTQTAENSGDTSPKWLDSYLVGADEKTAAILKNLVQNMDEEEQTAVMIGLHSTLTAYKLGLLSGEARFDDPLEFVEAWQQEADDFTGVDVSDYLDRALQHLEKNEFKNPTITSFFQKFDQLYRADYAPLNIKA